MKSMVTGVLALATVGLAACAAAAPLPDLGSVPLRGADDFPIAVYQGQDVVGGAQVSYSQIMDTGKPVVLNFWAGLCPPCRVEMPDLEATYAQYGDRVLLFGLDVGPFVGLGSNEDGQKLLKELKVTYPAGTTSSAEVVRRYEIQGMPTTVFIAPDGKVVQKWTGLLTKNKLKELIEKLLAASQVS
ncbi:MAG: TlpA family protein disulfide reductase [Chloroflexi bacterium]|nr:TlpA family protein disulfide reductase [Chloroflexota bacterium]